MKANNLKGQSSIAKWTVYLVVAVVIFTSLIGTISDYVATGVASPNVTGAASVMLALTTLFIVIAFVLKIVGKI